MKRKQYIKIGVIIWILLLGMQFSMIAMAKTVSSMANATNMKAVAGKNQVELSWKTAQGVDGYQIYRSTKKKGSYKK